MTLNKKNFIKFFNKNFVFEDKPYFAVAVSGGPDSMCLLHLLNEWKKINNGKLIALIINHNLRINSYLEALTVKKHLTAFVIISEILSVKKKKLKKKI